MAGVSYKFRIFPKCRGKYTQKVGGGQGMVLLCAHSPPRSLAGYYLLTIKHVIITFLVTAIFPFDLHRLSQLDIIVERPRQPRRVLGQISCLSSVISITSSG